MFRRGAAVATLRVADRRRIDVRRRGKHLPFWRAVREAFGMRGVGRLQDRMTVSEPLLGAAVVDVGWRQGRDAAVLVLMVVPREERSAPVERVLERCEPTGVARVVLRGLEVAFGERVVVARVRAAEAARDVEIAPRSECSTSVPGSTPCLATLSSISSFAKAAFSARAIIQPTT